MCQIKKPDYGDNVVRFLEKAVLLKIMHVSVPQKVP